MPGQVAATYYVFLFVVIDQRQGLVPARFTSGKPRPRPLGSGVQIQQSHVALDRVGLFAQARCKGALAHIEQHLDIVLELALAGFPQTIGHGESPFLTSPACIIAQFANAARTARSSRTTQLTIS